MGHRKTLQRTTIIAQTAAMKCKLDGFWQIAGPCSVLWRGRALLVLALHEDGQISQHNTVKRDSWRSNYDGVVNRLVSTPPVAADRLRNSHPVWNSTAMSSCHLPRYPLTKNSLNSPNSKAIRVLPPPAIAHLLLLHGFRFGRIVTWTTRASFQSPGSSLCGASGN